MNTTTEQNTLPAKLVAWGAAHGLRTRQQRADKLGISIHTLQDWEQGCHSPRGFALAALLKVIAPRETLETEIRALQSDAQDISHGVWTDAGNLADCLERGEVTAKEATRQLAELREQLDTAKNED